MLSDIPKHRKRGLRWLPLPSATEHRVGPTRHLRAERIYKGCRMHVQAPASKTCSRVVVGACPCRGDNVEAKQFLHPDQGKGNSETGAISKHCSISASLDQTRFLFSMGSTCLPRQVTQTPGRPLSLVRQGGAEADSVMLHPLCFFEKGPPDTSQLCTAIGLVSCTRQHPAPSRGTCRYIHQYRRCYPSALSHPNHPPLSLS